MEIPDRVLGCAIAEDSSSSSSSSSPSARPRSNSCPNFSNPAQATTMFRNLPMRVKAADFIQFLDEAGFEGAYDYFYFQLNPYTKLCQKGVAFVNFLTAELADEARRRLHLVAYQRDNFFKRISVKAAHVHGVEENLARLARSDRKSRLRVCIRDHDDRMRECKVEEAQKILRARVVNQRLKAAPRASPSTKLSAPRWSL